MIKFRRLSHQILAVSISVILAVLLLSGLATTILAQRIVTNNIIRGQRDLAISLTDYILFEMESNLQKLNELTNKGTIKEMAPTSLVTELRTFQSRNPTITNLYVADRTGQQIARSDFHRTTDVASIAGFKEALEGQVYFSDLSPVVLSSQYQQAGNTSFTSEWQDSVAVSILVPVLDTDEVIGVLGANIHLFRIQPLIESLTFTHDETVMVLSRSGEVVAHSQKTELGKLPELSAPELFDALEMQLLSVPENYNDEIGRTVKGAIYPIGEQGWNIVVQTPVYKLTEEVRGLWLLLALVLIGGVALTIAAVWLMASRLTHPISQLAHASEQVAAGELTTRVETNATNEVGTLADSFNRMVSELSYTRERNRQLVNELKQLNEDLEERVEQRTKELKVARDQADAANRIKSDFVTNLSHELRTPLTSIVGFTEALKEKYFGELNQKQADYIEYINENSQHMLSLISQIVDIEKIETGKTEMEISSVRIKTLLENIMSMVKDKVANKQLALDCQLAPEITDLTIGADESKLQQVVINMLSNAIMFTPSGGHISVRAKVVDNQLIIEVEDTGIGITQENQEKVFEDFFQVRNEIKDKTPGLGLGLGLGLSRRLVEMHGGKIWVESEGENRGSRFIFTIPTV